MSDVDATMDKNGNIPDPDDYTMLKHEVQELRSALTTVTEALVLFQEFVEEEICEMSYFRESGAFNKLAAVMNSLRIQKPARPLPNLTPIAHQIQEYPDAESETLKSSQQSAAVKNQDDLDSFTQSKIDCVIKDVFSVPQMEANPLQRQMSSIKPTTVTPVLPTPRRFIGNLNQKGIMTIAKRQIRKPVSLPKVKDDVAVASTSAFFSQHEESFNRSAFQILSTSTLSQKKNLKDIAYKKQTLSAAHKTKSATFTKPSNNITFKGRKKNRENPVKCYLCHRSYSSRGVMSRHLKEIHQIEPQFRCYYCPVRFRTGPARLVHMNASHPDEMKSVICPYCNRKSASPTGKRNHMLMCARKHDQGRFQQGSVEYFVNE